MVEQLRLENTAMTFDEVSMERSKNFVKALQELKNLRPQLYSAAEYCEKSYLHNEQKQMVLDNLKDYAVRALVNAVDHLGTVAYKLTDLFEQQTVDVSTVDVKITWLNQQILTCQAYTDKECLRQHQLSTVIPGHHKHYTLPASIKMKTQNSLLKVKDERLKNVPEKQRTNLSDIPASKTPSWRLASETKPGLDGVPQASNGGLDGKASGTTNRMFHMFDGEVAVPSTSLNQPLAAGITASSTVMSPLAVTRKDLSEVNKSLVAFRSLDNPARREMSRPPTRSKSVLSSFFVKHKSSKLK